LTGLGSVRIVEREVELGRTSRIGADSSGPGFKARPMGATVEEGRDDGGSSLGNTGTGAKVAGTSRDKILE